jgi:hypothetical protein
MGSDVEPGPKRGRSASSRKRKPPVDHDDEGNLEEWMHEWVEEETRGRRWKRSVDSKLFIEPSSSVGSSFGSNSEAESDSNTDLSCPGAQFKK